MERCDELDINLGLVSLIGLSGACILADADKPRLLYARDKPLVRWRRRGPDSVGATGGGPATTVEGPSLLVSEVVMVVLVLLVWYLYRICVFVEREKELFATGSSALLSASFGGSPCDSVTDTQVC